MCLLICIILQLYVYFYFSFEIFNTVKVEHYT